MEAETSKNYNQGLNWLFYMTWSDFENSPSLSSQPDWMTLTCPFQPSKSCKDSQKQLFYPVDYKNSISNSFSFTRRKRPRQLSGALQPWNKERVSTDTTKLFGASSAFHSLPLLWDGIPASPLKKKAKTKWKMSCEGADLAAAAALPQQSRSADCNTRPVEFLHLFWNRLSWEHTPACCVIPWLGL